VLLDENRPVIDAINRRLGYRLQLQEIRWPERVVIGRPFRVESAWANAGVAPCHPGGFMTLTIKDDEGAIIAVLSDESLDMRTLAVGAPGEAPVVQHASEFTAGRLAPVTRPGTYDLFVSVGRRDGTPVTDDKGSPWMRPDIGPALSSACSSKIVPSDSQVTATGAAGGACSSINEARPDISMTPVTLASAPETRRDPPAAVRARSVLKRMRTPAELM
jgi:hypothetical protein